MDKAAAVLSPTIAAPAAPTETVDAQRNIRASYADGAAFSLMVGCGETYFAAFALAVGLDQLTSGLLTSLPLIAGGLLQLAAPRAARYLGSLRRWVLLCATAQALVYVPLAYAALRGEIDAWWLYALAAFYWAAGMAAGPVWNTWIDTLIPKTALKEFLAVRSRLTQLAAFLAFLGGGLLLHVLSAQQQTLVGFAILFALAGMARLISVGFLARHNESPPDANVVHPVPLRAVLARFREPGAGRFLFFLLVSQVSVYVSAPFFSPYMLGHVGFSYAEYVALVSAAYVAKIAFYPLVARFVRYVGAYRALWIAGLGVAPPPLFWFWTPDLASLIVLQMLAGLVWAVFELSSTLLIFDKIAPKERIRILTLYNLFNAVAVISGALVGGALLGAAPDAAGYRLIFTVSAACRLLSLTALFGIGHLTARFQVLAFRTIGLRPSRGGLLQPILWSEDDDDDGDVWNAQPEPSPPLEIALAKGADEPPQRLPQAQ